MTKQIGMSCNFAAIWLSVQFFEITKKYAHLVAYFAATLVFICSHNIPTYCVWVIKLTFWPIKLQSMRHKARYNPKGARNLIDKGCNSCG